MYSHAKADWYYLPTGRPPSQARGFYRNWWLPFKSFVNSNKNRLAVILTAILIQFIAAIGAQASGRVALVLACEDYEYFKDSAVTVKWAREFGQALEKHNFDVTVAANGNDAQTRASLREFSLKAESADFALIVVSGHLVTYQSQSFFLPKNAKIRRATDLFSRALSLASVADIGGKARSGAMMLLTTVPDIPSTIPGIDTRPATSEQQAENVVTVFSSSSRVPVSRIDRVSAQAAEKLLEAAREEPLTLAALVNGASTEGVGLILGELRDMNLSGPLAGPASAEGSNAEILQAAERAARAQAEAELKASQAAIALDQAEKERRDAEKRLREEKERSRLAEKRARDAEQLAKQAQEEANKPEVDVAVTRSLQVAEDLLSWQNRKDIQGRLRSLRLYRGRVDAIFGPQTRDAIKDFQKLSGESATGYLTQSQLERLIETR